MFVLPTDDNNNALSRLYCTAAGSERHSEFCDVDNMTYERLGGHIKGNTQCIRVDGVIVRVEYIPSPVDWNMY